MWLTLLALSVEIVIVIALWRMRRRSAGLLANIVAVIVGLAAGCSIGLAAEGAYFSYTADNLIRPDIRFVVFWLVIGVLGFAAAMMIRPAQISGTVPCLFLALLCLVYAWHLDHEVWIAAALALSATAAVLWFLTASGVFGRGWPAIRSRSDPQAPGAA